LQLDLLGQELKGMNPWVNSLSTIWPIAAPVVLVADCSKDLVHQ
jgi:hypothetical protein